MEPKEGITIALRFGDRKVRRKFRDTAFFQVNTHVYAICKLCGTKLLCSNK